MPVPPQGPRNGHSVIVWGVEQCVECGVHRGGEQHQEAQLLPHPEPGVQPGGEQGVLGAPHQLEIRSQDAWNIIL